MRRTVRLKIAFLSAFASAILFVPTLHAQNAPPDPKSIPVIDGGIGPCSADFTINDAAGAPVYNAKIRIHIAYRFLNAHKLDLEVGTNAEGRARITGLPNKTKQPLVFSASDDPAKTCKADFTLALEKKSQ